MFKKSTCWIVLFYGVLLAVLGYVGYHNTGSKPSLIMGVGFGIAMMLSARLLFSKNKVGIYTSIVATVMLTLTFAMRYQASGKMIPGVLSLVSAAMLVFLAAQIWTERKR